LPVLPLISIIGVVDALAVASSSPNGAEFGVIFYGATASRRRFQFRQNLQNISTKVDTFWSGTWGHGYSGFGGHRGDASWAIEKVVHFC
jgi:hypothetical protein